MKKASKSSLVLRIGRSGLSTALAVIVLFAASPCLAGGTGTSFGTNLWSSTYYNPDNMYVDLFMHCTGWFNNTTPPTLNSEGYPVSGSATCLMDTGGYPSGIYQFYGKGKFTIDFRGSSYSNWPNNGTIPGTQQTVNGVTTALVQITTLPADLGAYNGSPQGSLLCDITVTDPNDLPTDFHLIEPGYKAWPDTNAEFTNEFLQALQPFTCFRLMQWMGTIASPVTSWAKRPQPNVFGQDNRGCAYERFIELANATNRDIWINIPIRADDTWAVGMAQLLKAKLKPGLHCYIELGNELWNWGYPYVIDWSQIETWDQTNSALTMTGAWGRHGQEVAFLLMHYVQIMQPIMGSQARFVLAGQFGNESYCSAGLAWIQQVYGPPSNYLYAIATAPYFGGSGTDVPSTLASLSSNMNLSAPIVAQEVAMAKQYGLKYCCYESGQSLFCTADNFSIYQAAQQDPGMGAIYYSYAQMLNKAGVDLCCFYDFIGDWDSWGFWGVAPDIRETTNNPTVKYAAEKAIANSGSQNLGAASVSSKKLTKAEAAAAAKAAEARARWAAEAAKIKAAEARAAAEAAKHKKQKNHDS